MSHGCHCCSSFVLYDFYSINLYLFLFGCNLICPGNWLDWIIEREDWDSTKGFIILMHEII